MSKYNSKMEHAVGKIRDDKYKAAKESEELKEEYDYLEKEVNK